MFLTTFSVSGMQTLRMVEVGAGLDDTADGRN